MDNSISALTFFKCLKKDSIMIMIALMRLKKLLIQFSLNKKILF